MLQSGTASSVGGKLQYRKLTVGPVNSLKLKVHQSLYYASGFFKIPLQNTIVHYLKYLNN